MKPKMTDKERKDKRRARRVIEQALLRCLRTMSLYHDASIEKDVLVELGGLERARRRL